MMHKILLKDAINILTTDQTYRKSVFFGIKNGNDFEEIDGIRVYGIRVDRGQIYNKSQIYDLGCKSLMTGIYSE